MFKFPYEIIFEMLAEILTAAVMTLFLLGMSAVVLYDMVFISHVVPKEYYNFDTIQALAYAMFGLVLVRKIFFENVAE